MIEDDDPLDELLRRAFAEDRARMPAVQVSSRVMARIRARQRARIMVLTTAAALGLAALVTQMHPLLPVLLAGLTQTLPTQIFQALGQYEFLGMLGAVVVAAWMLVVAEEAF